MPSFFPEGNSPVASESDSRILAKILGALTGDGSPAAQVQIDGTIPFSGSVSITGPVTIQEPLETTDGGPAWTAGTAVIVDDSDPNAGAVDVTGSPTAGQKVVVDDLYISSDTDMKLSFIEETTATVMAAFYITGGIPFPITTRGKFKLATADKKLQMTSDTAGNVCVRCHWHSES